MKRARVLLGAALTLMLLGAWWFADGLSLGEPGYHGTAPTKDAPTRSHVGANLPGTSREGHVAATLPPAQLVGGVFVSAEDGPLTFGAVELWCDDGRLAARAQLDEDGRLLAPACATTTCVRLRHPAFEQPIAWELAPDGRREFEVDAAPGLSGIVLSAPGLGVADASLLLRTDDGRRATARTDAAGEFAVALPGLRPCDICDLERGSPVCREHALDRDLLPVRVLVSAAEFAPAQFELALGAGAGAGAGAPAELVLEPPAAPITGVVRGADAELFESRTKVLATNLERTDEQHHAQVEGGQFEFSGLADARYRLRAVRDGRELAHLDSVAPGDQVELRAEQPARGVILQLQILDASALPVERVRVDGGPFLGALTDHRGRVEAPDVASGSYALRLRAADCSVVRAVVEVTPDHAGDVHQTLRLPSSCEAQ